MYNKNSVSTDPLKDSNSSNNRLKTYDIPIGNGFDINDNGHCSTTAVNCNDALL